MEYKFEEYYREAQAKVRAREYFHFNKNAPNHRGGYFSFTQRDTYHWDVHAPQVKGKVQAWYDVHPNGCTTAKDGADERAFRIRGTEGEIVVHDERWDPNRPFPREPAYFRSVQVATMWIVDQLQ